ncbi:MAG: DUF1646 family protein [Thermoplasmatota archaeon]
MPELTPVDMGLFALFAIVLLGPFLSRRIEENLELFLFACGVAATTIASVWSLGLVEEALLEPLLKGIVPAVLIAGALFHYSRGRVHRGMARALGRVDLRWIVFIMVVGLGLAASVITAIIAALILVELLNIMPLERRLRTELAIISCFSIGLGAVLTPLGEPLSTIAITALQKPPYNADFFFLMRHLGVYILPGVVAFGVIAVVFVEGKHAYIFDPLTLARHLRDQRRLSKRELRRRARRGARRPAGREATRAPLVVEDTARESLGDVLLRGLKVYVFVMALILLGSGMKVLVDRYFTQIPAMALYWVNTVSAVLDNATLTAAEISPALALLQIKSALMALLVAGGMLIPGNIPNIIAAGKVGVSSRSWARLGVPLGLGAMAVYFILLHFVPFP